jgi:hypothetical protein
MYSVQRSDCSFHAISMLMKTESVDNDDDDDNYTVTACSAFCPETHTTSVVLLQIEAANPAAMVIREC